MFQSRKLGRSSFLPVWEMFSAACEKATPCFACFLQLGASFEPEPSAELISQFFYLQHWYVEKHRRKTMPCGTTGRRTFDRLLDSSRLFFM